MLSTTQLESKIASTRTHPLEDKLTPPIQLTLDTYDDEKSLTEALAAYTSFDETKLALLVIRLTTPELTPPIWKLIEAYAQENIRSLLFRERLHHDAQLKQRLWQIVEKSREADEVSIRAAAQAITLLNASGESFSGKDLRGIRIPGANLSGGLFHGTQFQGANLTNVNFQGAWLANAKFQKAILKGICFGERAFIKALSGVLACQYSPDGRWLAVASQNEKIELYEVATHLKVREFVGHTSWVTSVVWDEKGERLASRSYGQTVRIWDVTSARELKCLEGHNSIVISVAWDSQRERLASGSEDQTVRVWDVASGTELKRLKGHKAYVNSVAWDKKGERLASASWDKTVRVWDVARGHEIQCLKHESVINTIAWDTYGERLASGSQDETVHLWDALSGKELFCLTLPRPVRSVALTPLNKNGKELLAIAFANTIGCFELTLKKDAYTAELKWLVSENTELHVSNLDLTDVQGLSANNYALLQQRGAIGTPHEIKSLETKESKNDSSGDSKGESKLTGTKELIGAVARFGTFTAPAKIATQAEKIESKTSEKLELT